MRPRLRCWSSGHAWGQPGRIWEDIFGNEWRIRGCLRCGSRKRRLHRAWDKTSDPIASPAARFITDEEWQTSHNLEQEWKP